VTSDRHEKIWPKVTSAGRPQKLYGILADGMFSRRGCTSLFSWYVLGLALLFLRSKSAAGAVEISSDRHAMVTLVMGSNSGYVAGAIALGQSLIDVGSKLARVVMVTDDVDEQSRQSMAKIFQVVEVKTYYCKPSHCSMSH
jgi:hypothetical protein